MESDTALAEFLTSLEATRSALLCAACRKPFNSPVKYLTCLHTVCGSHTGPKGNKFCAVCRADVRGSETIPDDAVQQISEAFLEMEALFKVNKPSQKTKKTQKEKSSDVGVCPPSVTTSVDKYNTRRSSNAESKLFEKKNLKGETPLHVACRLLKIDKILELLEKGANPNTKDNAGWTPLHEVTQKGSLEIVKMLLKHKALPDIPGLDNETPLHEAIRYGHKDIAIELVKNGADLNSKNIKGETPLQLADESLKTDLINASDDVQSQSQTIKEISMMQMSCDFEDMHVLCLAKDKTVLQKLKKLAKKHSITIESKFINKVTHLIVDSEDDNTAGSNVEILQAIVGGLWILNTKWVENSSDELEDFEPYEISGIFTKDFDGPKRARYNKYKGLPGLFDGCHFYLHGFHKDCELSKNMVLSKAVLSKIISDAGGKILRRVPNPESIPTSENTVPYHAGQGSKLAKCSHYIIFSNVYEPMYNMQHLKALPVGWLIECIHSYDLVDP